MIDRYREMDIMTASPIGLVVKLYEAALRNAFEARLHIENGRIAERAIALDKALAIVAELQGTLDFEEGKELSIQLHELYSFVTQRLLEANSQASTKAIDDAVQILETLLEAWHQIAQQPGTPQNAEATP